MSTLAKFMGYYEIAAGEQFQIARNEGGDTSTYTISLDNGGSALQVWPSGDGDTATDGTGDLLKRIEDQVQAAGGGTPFTNFTATIDTSTGLTSFALGAGETATLTWTGGNGATNLRDFLRLGSSTTSTINDTPSTGNGSLSSRVHELGFYPQWCLVEDLPRKPFETVQTRADGGQVFTISYAQHLEHEIAVIFQGGWRETSAKELHDLEELVEDHLAQGKRFRFYPDKTQTNAYTRLGTSSQVYGYHVLVASAEDLDAWQLEPEIDGWYERFRLEWLSFEYVS